MKKLIEIPVLVLFVILVIIACKKENIDNPSNGDTTAVFNPNLSYGKMTDQDGNVYKTITIGTQTWMAENLRTTKYNDGTSIPNVTGWREWEHLSTGAYCNFNNTTRTDTIATFGRLYNWHAVNTGKLAPKSWHVPTNVEWTTLTTYLVESVASGKLKESGTSHWTNLDITATNESGFTALPIPGRNNLGLFGYIGVDAYWWCTTEYAFNSAWVMCISPFNYVYKSGSNMSSGLSVRCIRD